MDTDLDFLDHLARESARFAEALRDASPESAVPSCPAWDADDLLWHLAEVQWFWGTVVREHVLDTKVADALTVERPHGRDGLEAFYHQSSNDLVEVLTRFAPEAAAWTWAPEQTVGFIRRRQAHEALIHRVDAELTAGARTEMDPELSSDGVDEVLCVMYGGAPPWGTFVANPAQTLQITSTDTGHTWGLVLGWFTGTDPDDDTSHDQADLRVVDIDERDQAAVHIAGRAADLDCWLWHREPARAVEVTGDRVVLSTFESTIAPGIN